MGLSSCRGTTAVPVDLPPARDWAASTTIPFFGALTGTDRTALLNDPLPERTWIYQLDRAAGTVRYEAANLSLELPVAPMLGTVGVAPPGREVAPLQVGSSGGDVGPGPGERPTARQRKWPAPPRSG